MRSINFNAPPRRRSFEQEQLRAQARRRKDIKTARVKFHEAAEQEEEDAVWEGRDKREEEVGREVNEEGSKLRVVDQKWANYNSARVPQNTLMAPAQPTKHPPPSGKPPRSGIRQTRRSLDMIAKARAQAKLEESRMEFFNKGGGA